MKPKIRLVQTADGVNYLVPFVLITTLFFLWGFAHSILDVLNKHFQDALSISKTHSALIQAVVYGGYFLMAMPAGEIIRRHGYRAGVVTGLLLYGIGALMFIPGEQIMSFEFFLLSLFIIGCGLTCLETAANPYVTVLGDKDSAERRINLAQSFNGLGWICGPLVGGLFLFAADGGSGSVAIPYAIIGILVLLVAIVFSRIHLPEITLAEEPVETATNKQSSLWQHRNFTFGLIALFFYVAAQTVAQKPGEKYNPLYIYGGPGLGKTHIMQAIGHYIIKNRPDLKVLFITAEEFVNDVVNALARGDEKTKNMNKFRKKYREVDVLLIDDIQLIAGKTRTEEEVFNTFNTLHGAGKQIVLTSDRTPKEIPSLSDRLISRFEWGLMADIQVPDIETRMAILTR